MTPLLYPFLRFLFRGDNEVKSKIQYREQHKRGNTRIFSRMAGPVGKVSYPAIEYLHTNFLDYDYCTGG